MWYFHSYVCNESVSFDFHEKGLRDSLEVFDCNDHTQTLQTLKHTVFSYSILILKHTVFSNWENNCQDETILAPSSCCGWHNFVVPVTDTN